MQKDLHFTSRMLTGAGALLAVSGLLLAVSASPAYGGICWAGAACMFFAARSFRLAEAEQEQKQEQEEADHAEKTV